MDVVWCHFPYVEKPGVPAPAGHPCLVLETNEYQPGLYSVRVVYGTSQVHKFDRGLNLFVSNHAAQTQAGLSRETVFDLGRYLRLPWDDAFFKSPDPRRWNTPVIGNLQPLGQEVLRHTLRERRRRGLPVP
jgi:hypothetical protein